MTTTYTAYFYTEADWAETPIKAATPALALQRARQIESEETETLDFQSYDSSAGVEHIEIRSAHGQTVAEWRHEDLLVRLAARNLLEACEAFVAAFKDSADFDDCPLAKARAAIAKAKPTA